MFNPLKTHGAENGGLKVGIAGFGGLGQMGVLMAKKMGNHVSVISTSNKKEALAKEVFEIALISTYTGSYGKVLPFSRRL